MLAVMSGCQRLAQALGLVLVLPRVFVPLRLGLVLEQHSPSSSTWCRP